jgi:Lon protease-like protein
VITTPIPLFPLGLVLLPGATVPLHIFEPRYRQMLRDVNAGTRCFGLIAPPADTPESDLPAGRIGCIACITEMETLPDGRSNILVEGRERFRFETYLETGTPYRLGHIAPVEDIVTDGLALSIAADSVRALAQRAVRASMTIHEIPGEVPEFTDDEAALSFEVAQLLQGSTSTLYGVLAERDPLVRLRRIDALLRAGLDDLELEAELHLRSKLNDEHDGLPPA